MGLGFFLISFFSFFLFFSFGWESILGFFYCDSISVSLVILSCWVTGLILLASYKVKFFGAIEGFLICVSLLCFVLVLAFFVRSGFFFYLFFELSLLPTLFLILGWGYQPERIQAGMYIIIYTVVASLPLLIIILFQNFSLGHSFFFFSWFSLSS